MEATDIMGAGAKEFNLKGFYDSSYVGFLKNPFSFQDRTYATNGNIIISVPKQQEYEEDEENFNKIKGVLPPESGLSFFKIPGIKPPEMGKCLVCSGGRKAIYRPCIECDGDAILSFDSGYSIYEVDCKTCDGEGEKIDLSTDELCLKCEGTGRAFINPAVELKCIDMHIDFKYLQLIKKIPGMKIAGQKEESRIFFSNGEITGTVMGTRV